MNFAIPAWKFPVPQSATRMATRSGSVAGFTVICWTLPFSLTSKSVACMSVTGLPSLSTAETNTVRVVPCAARTVAAAPMAAGHRHGDAEPDDRRCQSMWHGTPLSRPV